MAKHSRRRQRDPQEDFRDQVVVVCRGGDCGSRVKHPETDHRQQLRELKEALGRTAIASRRLDACEQSNVIVVIPSDAEQTVGAATYPSGGAYSLSSS